MVDDLFEVFEDLFERRDRKRDRDRDRDVEGKRRRDAAPPVSPPTFCVDCGARNEGNARFCLECGGLLPSPGEELRCPGCSTALPLKAKFCPRCGAKAAV
jgi:predicted amidophosphoribosyltransferase